MIIVRLKGGLGNQMFQYACGRALSNKYNIPLRLDVRFYKNQSGKTKRKFGLYNFNLDDAIITENEIFSLSKQLKKINEIPFKFSPVSIENDENVMINGYWVSEKYFKEIRSKLLETFTVRKSLDTENLNLLRIINNTNSVSLHVRRTDFLTIPHNSATFNNNVCSLSYYASAIKQITKYVTSPTFFVFSDDLAWVKKNLQINFPTIYVENNGDDKNYMDIYLMSSCKHNIIANSSFSWWGAWLNKNDKKNIIYPSKWGITGVHNMNDIIPYSWNLHYSGEKYDTTYS